MDVSHGEVVKPRFPHLRCRHRTAGSGEVHGVSVEHAHTPAGVALRPEALQKPLAVHAFVARAVDPAVQGFHIRIAEAAGEDMDVFRPVFRQPRAVAAAIVVVTRRNKHRHAALCQGAFQSFHRAAGGLRIVKNIACQQHHVARLPAAYLCNQPGQPIQGCPHRGGGFFREGAEGGIQVPIGGVEYSQSHWSTLSARRHLPDWLSRVNSAPSSLVAPSAQR